VLYVVADNGYAISVRLADQAPAPISEMVMGIRGLHVVKMDGRDYFEVRRKGADAIAHVRAGAGPCLIHALVTRPYSHSLSDDQRKYRGADELADEAAHDPIEVLERELVTLGIFDDQRLEAMHAAATETVRVAAEAALAAAKPLPTAALDHVVGPALVTTLPDDPVVAADAQPVTMGEAIRLTLHEQIRTGDLLKRRAPGRGAGLEVNQIDGIPSNVQPVPTPSA
jgi:2-oxoisovalerate dehydrogenase E1 component